MALYHYVLTRLTSFTYWTMDNGHDMGKLLIFSLTITKPSDGPLDPIHKFPRTHSDWKS